ncbi:MAG TPA: hypothetical protein VHM90_20115 [Phycisphaerae bacterium]|nr:hypothetical protein [Phycisphaerae bacterium]
MRYTHPALLNFVVILGAASSGMTCAAAEADKDQLVTDALSAAADIKGAEARGEALSDIVLAQARLGDIEGAMRTAVGIGQGRNKVFAFTSISEELALAGNIDGAKGMLEKVDADAKENVYRGIVKGLAKKGDLAGAKAAATNVKYPFYAALASRYIALAQAAAGDHEAARATIGTITNSMDSVEAYTELAARELKAKKEEEARKTMELARAAAKDKGAYPSAFLAAAEIRAGNSAAAAAIAARFSDASDRDLILGKIADAQTEVGDFGGAKSTAEKIPDAGSKIYSYAKLAPAMIRSDKKEAQSLLKRSVELLAGIDRQFSHTSAAGSIAEMMAKIDGTEAATTWARSQADPEMRVAALLGVISTLPNYHQPE